MFIAISDPLISLAHLMGDRHFAPTELGLVSVAAIYKHFAATRLRKINETPVSPFCTLNSQKTFLHLTGKYPNSAQPKKTLAGVMGFRVGFRRIR